MQLTARLPHRRTARPRRAHRPQPAAPPAPLPPPEPRTTSDARRGGGPEDRELYWCMCGYAFTAPVTTSVDCPHCGSEQAW